MGTLLIYTGSFIAFFVLIYVFCKNRKSSEACKIIAELKNKPD